MDTENKRFAPDEGAVDEVIKAYLGQKIKVYVIIYDGCECDVLAKSVSCKEE